MAIPKPASKLAKIIVSFFAPKLVKKVRETKKKIDGFDLLSQKLAQKNNENTLLSQKLAQKNNENTLLSQKLAHVNQTLAQKNMVSHFQTKTIDKLNQIITSPPFISEVATGLSMEESVCEYARRATAPDEYRLARSFVQALYDNSSQRDLGALGFGVLLTQFGLYESAFHYFQF
jgi:hypothetical protein